MRDPALPLRRRLYLLALVMLVVAIAIAASGCNATGSSRCDSVLVPQNVAIGDHGWTLRCDPDAPDLRYEPPSWVQGFADPKKEVVALWPDRIPTDNADALLRKTAWHELGHVVGMERGLDSEWWADGFAWCAEPISGVSYFNHPTDCENYR